MPCTSCKQKNQNSIISGERAPCIYDVLTLNDWLIKLFQVKQNNQVQVLGLTYTQINSYIGHVQTAIRNTSNPCLYENKLSEIANLIIEIDGL